MNIHWIYRKDINRIVLADIGVLNKPYAEKDGELVAWVFGQESELHEKEFEILSKLKEEPPKRG